MNPHLKYTLHPWHGIEIGKDAPQIVTAFIEIVPTDTVKYEIDKHSGWLKVDRAQLYSNIVPALYGFIPQTLCDKKIGDYCCAKTNRKGIIGDQDPLDLFVLSEKTFPNGGFMMEVVPIGGFRMIDKNEADDKIIAVMKNDAVYGKFTEISQLSEGVIQRLKHYLLTYKQMPEEEVRKVEIAATFGREEAQEIIRLSQADYHNKFNSSKIDQLNLSV
jgi:inorganic pyrophosphatase